jgi:glycosyltransferase involved in cell wall biosynthesis
MTNSFLINIILPVYNEELVLEKNITILKEFLANNLSSYNWQIIIADNNSQDQTAQIGQELAKQERIKYFFISQKGRGEALRRAFLDNLGDYYVYMDMDLATELSALPDLIKYLAEGKYDLVTGSRFLPQSKIARSLLREVVSRGYIFMARIILSTNLSDLQCGFKGINQAIIKNIVPQTKDREWFFDTELLVLAERKGYKIKEIPITWMETRNINRKSKVDLIKSIYQFINNLINFKKNGSKRI